MGDPDGVYSSEAFRNRAALGAVISQAECALAALVREHGPGGLLLPERVAAALGPALAVAGYLAVRPQEPASGFPIQPPAVEMSPPTRAGRRRRTAYAATHPDPSKESWRCGDCHRRARSLQGVRFSRCSASAPQPPTSYLVLVLACPPRPQFAH